MSSETLPIPPSRFAAALHDLPLSTLHLKVLELRNSIAHLDYSNEQLRPFALGVQTPIVPSQQSTTSTTTGQPDPDCVEAIRENEQVIERMQERIRLVRAEVENRGVSWHEFQSKEEADAAAAAQVNGEDGQAAATNGVSRQGEGDGTSAGSSPWTDGTFQTGVIRNGEVVMDSGVPGQSVSAAAAQGGGGGSISDEELRRRMEEQLRNLGGEGDDEEGGLHL